MVSRSRRIRSSAVGKTSPAGSWQSCSCRLHRDRRSGAESTGLRSQSPAQGLERTLRSRLDGRPMLAADAAAVGLERPKCTVPTEDAHTDRAKSRAIRVCAGVALQSLLRMANRTVLADSLGEWPRTFSPAPMVSLARWSGRHPIPQEPRQAARPRVAEALPARKAGGREGRGAVRRIGRRSLSPHESDRGLGSRGWRGACRSPTAGVGKEGTGMCAGRVAGVLEAVGPEREAAGVRKAGSEGRMIPGMRRNGAEVFRTAGPARTFGRRPSGRSEHLRPRRRRGRLGNCPHMRVRRHGGFAACTLRAGRGPDRLPSGVRRSGGDSCLAGEFHGVCAPGADDSGVCRLPLRHCQHSGGWSCKRWSDGPPLPSP